MKEPMEELRNTEKSLKDQLKEVQNWTAPGTDELPSYWLKHLESLDEILRRHLDEMVRTGKLTNG